MAAEPAAPDAGEKLVAVDLGNSGGRVYLGAVSGGKLAMQEVHRFANRATRVAERWYWDILRVVEEMEQGLRLAAAAAEGAALSIGIDSFGVDYCLIDSTGSLMAPPRSLRDPRTRGLFPELYKVVPREMLYRRTGAMEIDINTLLQLFAERREQPWLQDNAAALLFMPDFLAWALTGRRVSELTIASTSQLVDPAARAWARDVARRVGIPDRLLNPLLEPGTVIGPLRPAVAAAIGLPAACRVVAVASHDTAAAAAATPIAPDAAFISLGTWSLLGQELAAPVLTDAALQANFTNECGVGGRIVFHKILTGLWLLQECRRFWALGGAGLDDAALHEAALGEPALNFVFDVGDPRFLAPDDMPGAIRCWFAERNLPAPGSAGEIARAIYDSLALSYRGAIEDLEAVTGSPVRSVHIVGGGAQAPALCQATADATGRPVLAGPVEAAVAGNMICQLMARGRLGGLAEGRALIRRSTEIAGYRPAGGEAWRQAWRRLKPSIRI